MITDDDLMNMPPANDPVILEAQKRVALDAYAAVRSMEEEAVIIARMKELGMRPMTFVAKD